MILTACSRGPFLDRNGVIPDTICFRVTLVLYDGRSHGS